MKGNKDGQTWTSIPKLHNLQEGLEDGLNHDMLQMVLSVIQDGVAFISPDLHVLYSNTALKMWYGYENEDIGAKCFEAYHFRAKPCENCVVQKSILSKKPETAVKAVETPRGEKEWHRIFTLPVFDAKGELLFAIVYIRNITNEKKRTLEKELVEKQNQILQEISAHQAEEMRKREQYLMKNVNRAVEATLDYLKSILDERSYQTVRSHLSMAITGVSPEEEELVLKLTERERMIARLIREGYMSREIADRLCISKKAVDYHRTNLRKKLGLGLDDSLQEYLKKHLKNV